MSSVSIKKLLAALSLGAFVILEIHGVGAEEMMSREKPTELSAAKAPAMALSRADEILQRFDKNGDGRLDDDEKADAHEVILEEKMAKEVPSLGAQGLAAMQALALELFDANHDGRIDEGERLRAVAFVEEIGRAAIQESLTNRFDRNRDGTLDSVERREAQAYMAQHRPELMEEILLKIFDVNANGRLEPEEKTAIRAAFLNQPILDPITAPPPPNPKM